LAFTNQQLYEFEMFLRSTTTDDRRSDVTWQRESIALEGRGGGVGIVDEQPNSAGHALRLPLSVTAKKPISWTTEEKKLFDANRHKAEPKT
jgi:hypothetical protein